MEFRLQTILKDQKDSLEQNNGLSQQVVLILSSLFCNY